MQTVIDAELQQAYAAEWHSSAIDALAALSVPWAHYGSLSDDDMEPLAQPISALKHALEVAGKASGMPIFQAGFASGALARDAVVAARMGAAFSVTSLFEPMLNALDLNQNHPGRTALSFAVPNLGQLPWEAVAEYREHGGSEDARGKLRELEHRALAAEPDDPLAFAAQVSQSITSDLFAVIDDLQGSLAKQVGAEAVKTAISFLPVVGPFVGSATSMVEAVADHLDQRHAWYAALMKLREPPSS
jgi:hypothetical protein